MGEAKPDGTFKYSMRTATLSMKMDGRIRSPGHSAVVTAALDGRFVDSFDLLAAAPDMAEAIRGMTNLLVADTDPACILTPEGVDANDFANAFQAMSEALAKAEARS